MRVFVFIMFSLHIYRLKVKGMCKDSLLDGFGVCEYVWVSLFEMGHETDIKKNRSV